MTTTAQRVFDIAMGLIDEVSESGQTVNADTAEYRNRTLLILNALRGECYPYSDNYEEDEEGKRPVCPVILSMEDEIALDDVICQTVLPYGLAAQLLLDENPTSASFYQQRYEELLKEVGKSRYGRSMAIEDVYGTAFEYTEFARWG